MSTGIAESHVEEAALAWLAELGYATANGLDIGPDGRQARARELRRCAARRAVCARPSPS